MTPITSSCIAIGLLLAALPASAQTEAEAIRARVKEGQKVSITTQTGAEVDGRISSLAADSLSIAAGRERSTIPFEEIVRIDRPRDTLGNGALIGFGAGALLAVVGMAAEEASCTPDMGFFGCGDPGAGGYLAGAAIVGGLGAALGVGIDALIRRDREIYRRGSRARVTMMPSLGPKVVAGSLAVSW